MWGNIKIKILPHKEVLSTSFSALCGCPAFKFKVGRKPWLWGVGTCGGNFAMKLCWKPKVPGPIERALVPGPATLLQDSQMDYYVALSLGRRLSLSLPQCLSWVEGDTYLTGFPLGFKRMWNVTSPSACHTGTTSSPLLQQSRHFNSNSYKPTWEMKVEGILLVCINLTWYKTEEKRNERRRVERQKEKKKKGEEGGGKRGGRKEEEKNDGKPAQKRMSVQNVPGIWVQILSLIFKNRRNLSYFNYFNFLLAWM